MKRNTWRWIVLSGLSILLVGSVFACTSAPTAQPAPTEQTKKKPAQFEIGTLSVKPATVMVGYPATVAATVINSGDISGAYEASLMIDGEEIDRKVAWVDSGVPKEVSFQVTQTNAGSYELNIGNSNAKLTVCAWTPQTIQYDTGEYEAGVMGTCIWGEEWGHIVHFTPLAPPFKIQKISISGFTQVKNFADLSKRMFTVRIWNENSTQKLWSDDFPWSLFIGGGWKEIDVPDIIADGDFHVEIVTNSDAPPSANRMYINYEESKGETRSGVSYMGKVSATEGYAVKGKRWFIRVNGQGPPETCVPEKNWAEYVNGEYGFSVKYPSEWVERPELVTSPSHVAVFGVVDYTPGIAIVAVDADAPISADWLIVSYQETGMSNVKILSPLTETILADGTKATTYKANYIAASGYEVTAFSLDTDKGDKRIRLIVWTVEEYVPYDEALFSEIAHTLRFTAE